VPRNGARPGDGIWVTGTIGDGALGLAALRGELADPTGALAARYHLPTPRLGLARGIASAAIDISDGLFAELGHLARGAALGIDIDSARIPLSAAAQAAGADWRPRALHGGDDYELLLAVPEQRQAELLHRASSLAMSVTNIGQCQPGPPDLRLDGTPIHATGWSHFAA
jgi:thiamine-monophosphate kinase